MKNVAGSNLLSHVPLPFAVQKLSVKRALTQQKPEACRLGRQNGVLAFLNVRNVVIQNWHPQITKGLRFNACPLVLIIARQAQRDNFVPDPHQVSMLVSKLSTMETEQDRRLKQVQQNSQQNSQSASPVPSSARQHRSPSQVNGPARETFGKTELKLEQLVGVVVL
jgi:hypothetical protein